MAQRRIVTGDDVRALPEGSLLDVPAGTIFTDVAREWIVRRKIRVVESSRDPRTPKPVRIALGADHAGFAVKESLKPFLTDVGADFYDYGAYSSDPVDYPDVAHAVAVAVALGSARQGIVVDGAGMGSAMAANKVPGVRAAACYDEAAARNAREHNDANVLTLGSRNTPPDRIRKIVAAFLEGEHTEARHRARVHKILAIEKKYYRGF